MTLTLVAAISADGVIGAEGGLPWHLPEDFKRVKAITLGKTLVMGRRTFDSIGRPLPGRRTIVITRNAGWQYEGVTVAHSVEEALAAAKAHTGDGEVIIFGGGDVYAQTIDRADRLEITHVEQSVEGDTRFPVIEPAVWQRTFTEQRDGFSFATYRRRSQAIADLRTLLAGLEPELHDGEFVFCAVDAVHASWSPVATIREAEGVTVVLPRQEAEAAGLTGDFVARWITLTVHSDLAAVGLTAAVATALANDGIACNVIAGFHHDHLFVPVGRAGEAMAALAALAHTRP